MKGPDAVATAFQKAQKDLGSRWRLSGHHHDPRCTVAPRYSKGAIAGAEKSSDWVGGMMGRRYYPCKLVRLAAKYLNVSFTEVRGVYSDEET